MQLTVSRFGAGECEQVCGYFDRGPPRSTVAISRLYGESVPFAPEESVTHAWGQVSGFKVKLTPRKKNRLPSYTSHMSHMTSA